MGYSTDYFGEFNVVPPLNEKEIAFFKNFNQTRRCVRNVDSDGRYYVTDGNDNWGQSSANIIKNNDSPDGQPSLWCGFHASEDGSSIIWDGGEKTYSGPDWIKYFMTHFLNPLALMKEISPELYEKHGFQPHIVNGVMWTRGESYGDSNMLEVIDNRVFLSDIEAGEVDEFCGSSQSSDDEDSDEDDYDEGRYSKWYEFGEHVSSCKFDGKTEVEYQTENQVEAELEKIQSMGLENNLMQLREELNKRELEEAKIQDGQLVEMVKKKI